MRYDASGLSHNAARNESGSNQAASDTAMVVPANAMAQLARRFGQLIDRSSDRDGLVEAKCRDHTKDRQHGRIHAQITELIGRIDSRQRR